MAEEVINEPTPEVVPDPLFIVDDSTKEFFETYVGPGKKYANIGELAKGYANADRHLSEVTRDAGIFKTEAESLKELLMENLVKPNNEPNPNDPPNDPKGLTPPAEPPEPAAPKEGKELEEVDLKARVKEALEEVNVENRFRDNAKVTEEATIKRFGSKDDAIKAIEAKAEELGVSAQWIGGLAIESPAAYFATMGFKPDETPRSSSTPAPGSDRNVQKLTELNPGIKPNSYKYFNELRKTDPGRWRSSEVQQAILKAAVENPDFYS